MKTIIIAAALAVVAMSGYAIFSHKGGAPAHSPQAAVPPENVSVRYVAAEGKVEAMPGCEVEVGSEIDGRIAEIAVEEGSYVGKGEIIVRLENGDIQARLKEARAELAVSRAKLKEVASGAREEEIRSADAVLEDALAEMQYNKTSLERYRELFKKGAVSRQLLDEKETSAKTSAARVKKASEEKRLLEKGPRPETLRLHEDAVRQAEAAVEYYSRLLDKTYIAAPITGKVIRKYVQKGEMVNKDVQPYVVAIADVDKLRINAEVDETDIGRMRIGDPVEVTSYAFQGKIFKGVVREISDYAGVRKVRPNNPARNLDMKIVQVKIDFKEKTPFRLGMTVDVKIKPSIRSIS